MFDDDDRRDYRVLHEVIDSLRDDMREDNERLETRIMTAVNGFVTTHGQVHESDRMLSVAAITAVLFAATGDIKLEIITR